MRKVTKWVSIVVLTLLFGMMIKGCSGCGCDERPPFARDHRPPVGLHVRGDSRVAVGSRLSLEAIFEYPGGVDPTGRDKAWDAAGLAWTVRPSGGVKLHVHRGFFDAELTGVKPGVYTVTATGDNGLEATKTVTVTEAESTTTGAEPTTTEEEPSTTEIAGPNPFAGHYIGTMPLDLTDTTGKIWGHFDIPWEFDVDAKGYVEGGFDYPGDGLTLSLTFSGQVSEDGRFTAAGTSTVTNSVGTSTGPVSIGGQISGRTFAGTLNEADGSSTQVTATRQ